MMIWARVEFPLVCIHAGRVRLLYGNGLRCSIGGVRSRGNAGLSLLVGRWVGREVSMAWVGLVLGVFKVEYLHGGTSSFCSSIAGVHR